MNNVVQVISLEALQEKQKEIEVDMQTDTGDLSELFELFVGFDDEEDNEKDYDAYKELSFPIFEKTDHWDNRNYEPTEWELWLKECGTNAY